MCARHSFSSPFSAPGSKASCIVAPTCNVNWMSLCSACVTPASIFFTLPTGTAVCQWPFAQPDWWRAIATLHEGLSTNAATVQRLSVAIVVCHAVGLSQLKIVARLCSAHKAFCMHCNRANTNREYSNILSHNWLEMREYCEDSSDFCVSSLD